MNRIEFHYSNNVFLDNGIIGVYQFLLEEQDLEEGLDYNLEDQKL
jgi:hypothetical protein